MRFRWRSQAHFYPEGDYAHCNDERTRGDAGAVGMREMLTANLVPERVSVPKKNKVAFYSLANKFRDDFHEVGS